MRIIWLHLTQICYILRTLRHFHSRNRRIRHVYDPFPGSLNLDFSALYKYERACTLETECGLLLASWRMCWSSTHIQEPEKNICVSEIMGILQQTKYLIRKNFHIKKRNKRETLQEILIPIWWILLLLLIKLGVQTKKLPAVKDSEIPTMNVSTLGLSEPQGNATEKPTIGYVINDIPNAIRVMELVQNASKGDVNYLEFNSSDSMLEFYRKYSESKRLQVGVEFAKSKKAAGVAYTIRLPVQVIPSTENKLVGEFRWFWLPLLSVCLLLLSSSQNYITMLCCECFFL